MTNQNKQTFLGLIYPFLALAYMVTPSSSAGCLMKNPTVKFWCWIMSEVYFVTLLIWNTVHIQNETGPSENVCFSSLNLDYVVQV